MREASTGIRSNWPLSVEGIRGYCGGNNECVERTLRSILLNREVLDALAPLACVKNNVVSRIESDPRFRSLRPYADVIIEALESTKCGGRLLELEDRPPTYTIESSKVSTWLQAAKPAAQPSSHAGRTVKTYSVGYRERGSPGGRQHCCW